MSNSTFDGPLTLESRRLAGEVAKLLDTSFDWSFSPQGNDYWNEVYENLSKMAEGIETDHDKR